MKRRAFLTVAGGAAAWPLAGLAQQRKMPIIGVLISGAQPPPGSISDRFIAVWREGLGETGFTEGRNVAIESRYGGDYGRLPGLAADLVGRQVDVIYAGGGPAAVAAKAATSKIPVVFWVAVDPVALGLVKSLNRPEGNLTGGTGIGVSLSEKLVQLLHELVPSAASFGFLMNPANRFAATHQAHVAVAARALGLRVAVLTASNAEEIQPALIAGRRQSIGALLVAADPLFYENATQLSKLAAQYAFPSIYPWPFLAKEGGLIAYGAVLEDMVRQLGNYVGRILKGEKPADLPVMQPTRFELVINLKTARALGLAVPQSILARADEVIE